MDRTLMVQAIQCWRPLQKMPTVNQPTEDDFYNVALINIAKATGRICALSCTGIIISCGIQALIMQSRLGSYATPLRSASIITGAVSLALLAAQLINNELHKTKPARQLVHHIINRTQTFFETAVGGATASLAVIVICKVFQTAPTATNYALSLLKICTISGLVAYSIRQFALRQFAQMQTVYQSSLPAHPQSPAGKAATASAALIVKSGIVIEEILNTTKRTDNPIAHN